MFTRVNTTLQALNSAGLVSRRFFIQKTHLGCMVWQTRLIASHKLHIKKNYLIIMNIKQNPPRSMLPITQNFYLFN